MGGDVASAVVDPDGMAWLQFLRTISSDVAWALCGVGFIDMLEFMPEFMLDPGRCEMVLDRAVGCGKGTVDFNEGVADDVVLDPGIDELLVDPGCAFGVDVTVPDEDDDFVVPDTCLRTLGFLRRTGCATVFGMDRTDL